MRLRDLCRALCGLLFCIPLMAANAQTIWYVNDDAQGANTGTSWTDAYTDLHSALAAAQSGDQIWVAAGRYVGNFTLALGVEVYGGFVGTETELTQRDWNANLTTLDGNQTGSVVTSPPGATATTRIDGFTITNGSGTVLGPYSYTNGGGLYMYNSSPTIANNKIAGNNADYGGGLFLFNGSYPTIANNTIRSNSAHVGGGMFLHLSSPTLTNNAITGNSAYFSGGGLYLYYSSPTIANNTITGNSAHDYGVVTLISSSPTIANTIVALNSSGIFQSGDTAILRFNCVFGNGAYDYSGLTDPTGTDGNISADPRLADPRYGNVHIQPDSPCVNAGNNADTFGDFDIDGQPRIQPVGGTVDIGADESDGSVWTAGPNVIVRVSTAGDDANDGSSWTLAKRSVRAGINAASALGGEVWVQAGTYYERITLSTYAYVYGGFAGAETARGERNWGANITTLDGQQQGSVVTAQWQYGAVSVIDGFTITNGRADYGGGLYLELASPTIVNNTITGNIASSGGGLFLSGSSATIANNTITGNIASQSGGGLHLWFSSPPITNNTVSGNRAYDGGGLYVQYSSPTIANTIVAFNSSGVQQDIISPGTPSLRYNCVYGNSAYDYSGLTDPTGTDGNISADPAFVRNPSDGGDGWGDDPATPGVDEGANDDYGDVRLRPGSPAINAGDPGFVPQPGETDLDGHARVLCRRVDMGAYEFGIGDYDCDQSVDMADFAAWDSCMGGPSAAELRIAKSEERMTNTFDPRSIVPPQLGNWKSEFGNHQSLIDNRSRPTASGAINNLCAAFDFDADGDTDLRDFAGFQRAFTGQ